MVEPVAVALMKTQVQVHRLKLEGMVAQELVALM
tara:strand:- start:573 stop:674 length:102 start_codon:yes stop_codon:yes gene_type:complete